MKQALVTLQSVSKQFDNQTALKPVDLDIQDGEFLTILGPSGCGKTTLLRLISGFEKCDSGKIILKNQDISDVPPEKRHINLVFQQYALFPHMRVFQNVAFGLQCQKYPREDIENRVNLALERVKLTAYKNRKPENLSGGQQQRVAIARAIVNEPLLLLLDEPLSALDYSLRKQMRLELKNLQRKLGITFVLVTHDQEEALTLSDRVVVMNEGKIEQIGAPRDVYEDPRNLFVTRFIGEANIFSCKVTEANQQQIQVVIQDVSFTLENTKNYQCGDTVHVVVRPEDMESWNRNELNSTENMLRGKVIEVIYKGSTVDLVIELQDGQLIHTTEFFNEDDEDLAYEIGERVYVNWKAGWEVILPYEN